MSSIDTLGFLLEFQNSILDSIALSGYFKYKLIIREYESTNGLIYISFMVTSEAFQRMQQG